MWIKQDVPDMGMAANSVYLTFWGAPEGPRPGAPRPRHHTAALCQAQGAIDSDGSASDPVAALPQRESGMTPELAIGLAPTLWG